MKPIACCTKNTKKQLLLSAVVSPKLMREKQTAEVWVENLQDNLFRALEEEKKVLRVELIVFFGEVEKVQR